MPKVVVAGMPAGLKAEEASFEATVIRCGCAARGLDFRDVHERFGEGSYGPCPEPLRVEDRGTIAYYHRNPLKRWWWQIRNAWKEGRQQWN